MTLDEGIKFFESLIEDALSSINAQENLPGIYYDKTEIKKLNKAIKIYNQFIDWFKELKKYKEEKNEENGNCYSWH